MKGISLKPFRTKLIILNPSPAYFSRLKYVRNHSWASASRHSGIQYQNLAPDWVTFFQYWTGSGSGIFIWYRTDWMAESPAF